MKVPCFRMDRPAFVWFIGHDGNWLELVSGEIRSVEELVRSLPPETRVVQIDES